MKNAERLVASLGRDENVGVKPRALPRLGIVTLGQGCAFEDHWFESRSLEVAKHCTQLAHRKFVEHRVDAILRLLARKQTVDAMPTRACNDRVVFRRQLALTAKDGAQIRNGVGGHFWRTPNTGVLEK